MLTLLQYGCVLLSGFLKSKKGVYSFTLDHWNELWSIGASPIVRSVAYALIVAVVGTLFAALFAYYMDRRRVPGRELHRDARGREAAYFRVRDR